ncbi:MAG TPA: SHOCT domain-containing protein [Caldilineaceae bacterium]|nr:SHOCT domain-containing protein [Caldilineaceae bacterium]
MMGGGMDWGWFFSGGLLMLLFWGGLIALVVMVLRSLTGGATHDANGSSVHRATEPTALEILQARYARGEISQEEYKQMKATLQT